MNLKIGEIVHISTIINKESCTLLSSGFTNTNVHVSKTPNEDAAEKARNGFFMVLPSGNFEMHDEILKITLEQDELKAYQSRLDTEKKLFEANIQNSKDQPVKFGSQIVFKHIDSGSYLSGCFECSEGGTGGFKVILSQILNSMIVFRLQSYQSFLKDGDKVSLNAPLYIFNLRTKCYIDMEGDRAVSFSQKNLLWHFSKVKELPLIYVQHTRVPGYLCCDKSGIKYLQPKEGYKIYDSIWIDYGDRIGRQKHSLPVKNRIRTFVDINIDLNGVIRQTQEYKQWAIEAKSSLQDCFQLIPIDIMTYKQILFIQSTIGALKNDFMQNLQQNLNYNKLIKLQSLINQIINFIKGITKDNKSQQFFIVPRRQFLMRDLGSLELIFSLIMKLEQYTREGTLSKIQNELVKSIFSLLYQCIVKCCLDNENIKSYFSPHLKQIYLHCVNTHIENVLPKIISLTKPPQMNLEEFQSSNILYLNFLSLLSQNNLNHNQIYNKLKSTKWVVSDDIDLNGMRWRYSEEGDYQYLIQWIEMCSKICQNRNLRAQTIVTKHVQLPNLLSLIRHPFSANSQIFKKLIALLHYCYVDTIDLNPIVLDQLCEYNNLEKPVKTKKSLIAEESTKILANYVQNFQFQPADMMKNQNFLQMLRLLNTTLLLGFWEFDSKFNKLVTKLVDILKIHDQKTMFSQKKQNLLVINVKYAILKIINTVIDFKLDQLTKKLTLKFKNLHQKDDVITSAKWSKIIEDVMQAYEDPKPQIQLCKTLIQLCQYPNVELLSTNLSTVRRLFSFKDQMLHIFQQQYLLDPTQNLVGFTINEIKQIRQKLFILKQPTLKYANLGNQSQFGTLLWSPNINNKGLIQYIWELACWMKQQPSPAVLQYQKLAEDQLYMFFNETEQNIKLHQQILKSLKLPSLLVQFLVAQDQLPQGEVAIKLMYIIYYFLTLLVWNSLECKNEVIKYLPIIKKQLFFKLGAPYLLRQLFDNNPGLIYNQSEFQEVIIMILDHISKQQQSQYTHHTSKLIDLFRCTLYYNEKAVPQNQIFILSKLQEYGLIVLEVDEERIKKLVRNFNASYKKSLQTFELEIPPYSTFLVTIFNLFGILVEDNNMINIGKCRQIHPFRQLVRFCTFSRTFWMLKRNIRAYMNKLYYMGKDYNMLLQLVKLEDLQNLVFDLNHLILMSLQGEKIYKIKVKNPVRFEYFYTYVYLNFQQILISLYHMMNNVQMKMYILKSLKKDFQLGNFQIHYRLMRIIERLSYIKINIYFQSRFLRYLINNAITNIQNLLMKQPHILVKVSTCKMKDGNLTLSPQTIISQVKRGDIRQFFISKSDSLEYNDVLSLMSYTSGRIVRKNSFPMCTPDSPKVGESLLNLFRGLFFKKKNDVRKIKFDEYVKELHHKMKQDSELNQQLQDKFSIKSLCDKNCNQKCQNCKWSFFDSTSCRIEFEEYIKILLKENCANPLQFPKELKIFLFEMISEYISSKNQDKGDKRAEGENHYWKQQDEEEHTSTLTSVQLYLRDCNFQQLICSTIQKCRLQSDLQLVNSLFVASIQFLSEGNTQCQNALLDEIRKDENNLFMRKMNDLIIYVTKKIVEDNEVKKPQLALNPDFYLCHNDTYDYYDPTQMRIVRKNVFEPDTMKQINQKKLIVNVFSNLFDFLHQLCQNNNVDAKNLIKFQGNPRNTVNLLETAVVSLRKMVKVLNPKIITMPSRLLGFINETTQLPCIDNQIFMAKSTLFEDMSKMQQNLSYLFYKTKEQTSEDQQPVDEGFLVQIQSIYHQFMNVLISISEGNCESIYNQFRKIPPIFFIRVAFNYLKQMGLSLKDPLDIFNVKRQDPITEQFIQLIAKPDKKDIVEKLLELQILSKQLQYTGADICPDYVKFFKSPFFSVLPQLIQIQIQGQPQFFCPAGEISQQTKSRFVQDAPRTTQRQKIIYLLQHQYQAFNELQYQKDSKLDSYKLGSQIVAILINILISLKDINIFDDGVEILANRSWILWILKVLHLILILIYVIKIIMSEKAYLFDEYQAKQKKRNPKNILIRMYLLMKLVFYSGKFKQILFNILSTIVAFKNPTLYSIHVFAMFSRIQSLNSVFEAIQINIRPLSVVGIFGIVFFYIFSLVSLDFYSETLYTDKNQEVCTNWLDCILDLYISGTVNSSTVRFAPSRFFLDLVYFIFFGLLFGNIISGLMTDTFKELRSQKDEIEFDENNYCYICGINRETLQRNGEILNQSFRTAANKALKIHEDRHDRFNYLLYIYMLKTKDESQYTGLQYKIMNKLRTQDISWIPSFERETTKSSESGGAIQIQTKQILDMISKLPKK